LVLRSPGCFGLRAPCVYSRWRRGLAEPSAQRHVLTGFPWNDFGMAPPMCRYSRKTVHCQDYGLDLLTVLIFAAPATLIDSESPTFWISSSFFACILLAGMTAFGALRLSNSQTGFVEGVKLRLMQQTCPWTPSSGPKMGRRFFADIWRCRTRPRGRPYRHRRPHTSDLAESAFPFVLSRETQASRDCRAVQGKILITGAARVEEGAARRAAENLQRH